MAGCKNDLSSLIVYFELSEKPDTLDPQLASTDQELLIVRNIYEGLLRENSKGEIVSGVAESYKKEGLVYTFKLRKDAMWSTEEPLRAEDFVFAFRRAVDSETNAPFVKRLFSIKNAEKIYQNKAAADTLGIRAIDDTTLQITLIKEDESFEKTLTTSICMPCNQKFFASCDGQYGLKSEYTISNGSYSITKWNREDFGIRIYRNKAYKGDFVAQNGAVFISLEEDTTPAERLSSNKVDIAFIDNQNIDKFKNNDFTVISYQNTCWFLTISNDFNKNIRQSFSYLINSRVYESKLPTGFTAADSIFPEALNPPADCKGAGFSEYNQKKALSLFSSEVVKIQDKKFPTTTLTYLDNETVKPAVTAIVGHLQQSLSAFINISPYTNNNDLLPQLKNPTLPLSVFYIKSSSSYRDEYLENFSIEYNGKDLSEIQKEILKKQNIIPIAFENTNIVYSKYLSEVYSKPDNGYIDFSSIIKKD